MTASTSHTQPHLQHPTLLHTLLSRAHSPTTAQRIITDKLQNKPVLLQPTLHTDSRALRRHVRERKKQYHTRKQARRGTKPLSAREKREKGVYNLKKEEINVELYRGLNELWNGYMREILGFVRGGVAVEGREASTSAAAAGGVGGGGGQGSILASADMHGAEMEVVRSRDVGRVGLRGFVVRETKFAFVIVGEDQGETRRSRSWCVPKKGSVFAVSVRVPGTGDIEEQKVKDSNRKVVFEIQGNLFEYRPVERASRKFKFRMFDDV